MNDLVLVDMEWMLALDTDRVVREVAERLIAAGAVTEHRQLLGLSAQETAVLVRRELDCPSGDPQHAGDEVAA